MLLTLASAGATFASTVAGGLAALSSAGRSELLFAPAGGLVLGAAVFDLLTEAINHFTIHSFFDGRAIGLGFTSPIESAWLPR